MDRFSRSVVYSIRNFYQNANRKVDALGRIVIPSKLRNKFAIEPGDKVEFFSTYVDGVWLVRTPRLLVRKQKIKKIFLK